MYVERLCGRSCDGTRYQVQLEGRPPSANYWEDRDILLINCRSLVEDFDSQFPFAPPPRLPLLPRQQEVEVTQVLIDSDDPEAGCEVRPPSPQHFCLAIRACGWAAHNQADIANIIRLAQHRPLPAVRATRCDARHTSFIMRPRTLQERMGPDPPARISRRPLTEEGVLEWINATAAGDDDDLGDNTPDLQYEGSKVWHVNADNTNIAEHSI